MMNHRKRESKTIIMDYSSEKIGTEKLRERGRERERERERDRKRERWLLK
jgi:hypothetical protein